MPAKKPVRGQRVDTNKKTTAAKKKAMPKIPKDMSKMKLSPALTPAQRQQQASVDQQTRAGIARKKNKKVSTGGLSAPLQKRYDAIIKSMPLSSVEKANVRTLLKNPKGFTNAEIKKMAGNKGKARGK